MNISLQFEEFKSGKEDAFRVIFDHYNKALFLFARRFLSDSDEIEDLIQEIFIMLWEKKETLRDVNALKSFLYTSVRNKSLNILRHKKIVDQHQEAQIQDMEEEFFYAQNIIDIETYRLLHEAIETLPDQTKKVSHLSLNGAKNTEIAEQLNISTSTVKYHKQQALKILRERLSDNYSVLLLISLLLGKNI